MEMEMDRVTVRAILAALIAVAVELVCIGGAWAFGLHPTVAGWVIAGVVVVLVYGIAFCVGYLDVKKRRL